MKKIVNDGDKTPKISSSEAKRHVGIKQMLLRVCSVVALIVAGATVTYMWQHKTVTYTAVHTEVHDQVVEAAPVATSTTPADAVVLYDEKQLLTQREINIQEKRDFIVADLKKMEMTLYQGGIETQTLKILSKGKVGSWWETPTGNYTILSKWENKFSSIGSVWMPYSMQFYGNYFIHGWPYYEGGVPVSKSYSGGCIRLSTEDAKIVFEQTKPGTSVLVLEDADTKDFGTLVKKSDEVPLSNVHAKTFRVTDLTTGKVLIERQQYEKVPIASVTKLMTAITAHELLYLGRQLTVTESMISNPVQGFNPVIGQSYLGLDLLYPLLIQSSNDSAQVIARSIGEKTFVNNMNAKASALGMKDTTFADASGIRPENVSTAADITKLLTYIYYKRPFIYDITKGKVFPNVGFIVLGETIDIAHLKNYNEFAADPALVGMKNGETRAAQQTMASVWRIKDGEREVPVAIVVLGSDVRSADTQALFTWVKNNYSVEVKSE